MKILPLSRPSRLALCVSALLVLSSAPTGLAAEERVDDWEYSEYIDEGQELWADEVGYDEAVSYEVADAHQIAHPPASSRSFGSKDEIDALVEEMLYLAREVEELRDGRYDDYRGVCGSCNVHPCCCNKPQVGISGAIRLDLAALSRVPQYGSVIHPATVQIPLDKQNEHRHAYTLLDGRGSFITFDVTHCLCDTKVVGLLEMDFNTELDLTRARFQFARGNATLNRAFLRAHFDRFYLEGGLNTNLMTVTRIASPRNFPICDLQHPVGYTSSTQPLVKIGACRKVGGCGAQFHWFAGMEQQLVFRGIDSNDEIALRPARGEPYALPMFAAGMSFENLKLIQVDVRGAVSQNRYAIGGSREAPEATSWMAKVSAESQFLGFTAYGAYSYMNGMNRFAQLAFPDSVLDSDYEIHNVKGHGVFGGLAYEFWGCAGINGMLGYAAADEIIGTSFDEDMYNRYMTGQVALWYKFCCNYAAAVEYKRWDVESINGAKGNTNIYMATLAYLF